VEKRKIPPHGGTFLETHASTGALAVSPLAGVLPLTVGILLLLLAGLLAGALLLTWLLAWVLILLTRLLVRVVLVLIGHSGNSLVE
jgi:hypothetical protein